MKKLVLFIIPMISLFIYSNAQDSFSTKKVAIFKNGTGFFIKSGKVDVTDGKYLLKTTPDALFGTMWVSSVSSNIKALYSLKEKSVEEKEAESIKDLLSGNIGKKAKIYLHSGTDYDATIKNINANIVTIQTKDKWVTTNINEVSTVEFLEQPSLKYNMKTSASQLAISFANSGKNDLYLMYLQKGIGWFPSYLVQIEDNGKANIQLRSTVMNDVEDIKDAELNFVVGVPNFKYNYLESPLTADNTLESFINNLNAGAYRSYNSFDNSGVLSNAIMTQAIATDYESSSPSYTTTEFSAEVSNQEDLYFYKHENITLKKGERATFELLSTKVPFEHIYEVSLNQNSTSYYSYNTKYADTQVNKVWHSLKLKNASKMPWTTGTAMVVKKENGQIKPISQDMMKYTPVSSDSYLKITVSPDITVKDKDNEINRSVKNKKNSGSYYDLVTVEGNVLVKNYKDKDIKLNIQRNIVGTLKSSSTEWEYTKMPSNYYYNLNPTNQVEWEIDLKAGEEKEITYKYTIYVYS